MQKFSYIIAHFLKTPMLLGVALMLAACAAPVTPAPAPQPSSLPPAVELTEEQNGGLVALKVGDLLTVRIEGNPTTGFTWEPDQLDSSLLEQQGEPVLTRLNNLTGGPSSYLFTFKAVKAGTTTLRLIYHRSWEKGVQPERIFESAVDIQAGG